MNRDDHLSILCVLTLSSWGGAPQVVFETMRLLDRRRFAVAVACGTGEGWERMKTCGGTVFPLACLKRGISPLNDLRTLLRLYLLIRRGRYDIVHCHSSKGGLLGRIAARLAGAKAVYFTAHGWGFYNQQEYGWAERVMTVCERIGAKCSDKIVCVSESARQDAIRWNIAKPDKFIVVRNGISWLPKISREEVRRHLRVEDDAIVFGMVGRLAYPKHPMMFLQAAKRMHTAFKNAMFVLVGGGPFADECKGYVKDNGLDGRVLLLGERPPAEARNLLLGFDAFVLSSRFEGLPLTIIEAMFAGLPVVASDVGGVKELVQNNRSGFLFAADDLDELTGKIEYLARNRDERLRMGREGHRIAQLHFSAERMTRQYESLYLRGALEEQTPPLDTPPTRCSSTNACASRTPDEVDSSTSSYKADM